MADTHTIEQDIAALKTDMTRVKEDTTSLKADVGKVKEDIAVLKLDIAGIKAEMRYFATKADLEMVKGEFKANLEMVRAEVERMGRLMIMWNVSSMIALVGIVVAIVKILR